MSYFQKYNKYKNKYYEIKNTLDSINSVNTVNSMDGGHNININDKFKYDKNEQIRCVAHKQGELLLNDWIDKRTKDGSIDKITALFNEDGSPITPPSATTFNDLYKWTMMPVIRKLETYKNNNIIVTFGIDLRDEKMRVAMKEYPELRERIHRALKGLEERPFNRRVFEAVLSGPRAAILEPLDIDAICTQGGATRNLVEAGGVKNYDERYERTAEDNAAGKVTVTFYEDSEKEYKAGEKGLYFIEATGPWHRVSWLETSMMQCVYEAKLRFDLEKKGITYNEWLYHALLRCAKSVAYTQAIQIENPGFKPALFTGRRTGGLLFLLLQNLFFADNFNQFNPKNPSQSAPHPLSLLKAPLKHTALGTSSVDSWYLLQQPTLKLPCLDPVGTHAHELSMVTSVLFPHVDQNPHHLPLTQIIGHYLYAELVWRKTGGLMAMLPDTLGTRAFMKAANYITITTPEGPQKILDIIGTGRQDSGKLKDFIRNMREFGFVSVEGSLKGMMASEIDTTDTLLEASELGYSTFGAGGFFGDSEKVWGDKNAPSNSMAVKAVRVMYQAEPGRDYSPIHYMKVVAGTPNVIGYPVKVGDPSSFDKPELGEGKLSLDKNLPEAELAPIKAYANRVRVSAQEPLPDELVASKPIESFFTVEKGVNYAGLVWQGGGGLVGETNIWFNYFFN